MTIQKEVSQLRVEMLVAVRRMKVRVERLETMYCACAHVLSETPEEDAWKKLEAWAGPKGLLEKSAGTRVFGRNTYPTNDPEPHGYEFLITVKPGIKPEGDIRIKKIPGGLYAVLRFMNLDNMGKAWRVLWEWIEKSEYDHIDWQKGDHGWYNGFEEHLNWHEKKPTTEWIFDLWVQFKE